MRGDTGEARAALRAALRNLRVELSINSHRVAGMSGLNDSDLSVLDVLAREGAQSPTALARRVGLHAATMTGVLARLQRSGWIVRRPDAVDRRGVQIEPVGFDRLTEVFRDGNLRLDEITDGLTAEQADVVLGYLQAVTRAVHAATAALSGSDVSTTAGIASTRAATQGP